MGDSLKAWITIMENIQEEFGYDIQEMKVQLVRLTKLIEGHTWAISETPMDPHLFHCNQLYLLSYINDI